MIWKLVFVNLKKTITNLLHIFVKKSGLFNSFFAKQCSIFENNSVIPSTSNLITAQYLANIEFRKNGTKRILCKVGTNEVYCHDTISIHMLKTSSDAIFEPLFKIFKNWWKFEKSSVHWEKRNHFIYIYLKKATNKTSKNYCPLLSSSNLPQGFEHIHII